MNVYDELAFHYTDEKFYFKPNESKELLTIDRISNEIQLEINKGQVPLEALHKVVYGIVGIINLISGPCLIIITQREEIGILNNQKIWKLKDFEIIPYRKTTFLSEQQKVYNDKYLSLVQQVLKTPYFYFSYDYDLSHTLERLYFTAEEFIQMPLHERADLRFLWNQHLLRDLSVQSELSRFCLPIIHGFVSCKKLVINQEMFTWALISRRSVYRAGTRMWTRGIDADGHVANYVETEQVIEFDGWRSSFVQTRGSIPLFWTQMPDLRYKPPPTIPLVNHEDAFARHCESQVLIYGRQVFVNLVNQGGSEGKLQEAFRLHVMNSNRQLIKDNVKYEYFDFHHECRKMQWHRLSILMDRLAQDQKEMGYFLFKDGMIISDQSGVFRTNCIDCLDRTNVVQTMLAEQHLVEALTKMQIITLGTTLSSQPSFYLTFKGTWADHADVISEQYSGTAALKTEFTRYGVRTKEGLIRDGIRSAIRYIKNNFFDGDRQNAIDLFLGKYVVEDGEGASVSCPLKEDRNPTLFIFPFSIFFSLLMVFASGLLANEYTGYTLLSLLFWGGMTVASTLATFNYGQFFVNSPKLCGAALNSLSTSGKKLHSSI